MAFLGGSGTSFAGLTRKERLLLRRLFLQIRENLERVTKRERRPKRHK